MGTALRAGQALGLPPGGRGGPGELPWAMVALERMEELGVAEFPVPWAGTARLWHLVAVGRDGPRLRPDEREFAGVRWADPMAVLAEPLEGLDPHMHRFVAKLRALTPRA